MRQLVLILLLTLTCSASEIVYLKNGDRVTGSVEKFDAGKIVVKSTVFGEVKIDVMQVARVESNNTFTVASATTSYAAQ
jgi:hypothetical protein